MPDEGEKGNSVELGTFKNWGHNLIGYKTIQKKEKTYVNFVWCKVCAKHKNALKSNPACQGQAKIALQKYIEGTNFVSKHTVNRHLTSKAHSIALETEAGDPNPLVKHGESSSE